MASEWDHVGTAGSDASGRVAVFRDPAAGDVKVVCSRPEVVLSPAAADDLAGLLDRAAMPGQPASCAYCEDDPDHPDPDNAGTCTCRAPGCGRGWCPKRDAAAELGQPGAAGEAGAGRG